MNDSSFENLNTMEYSVIIPARNEQELLQRSINSVRTALKKRPAEIIVVLNRCTDKTAEIAIENTCLTVVNDQKNLSLIRNAGVGIATGRFIVTIDADSILSSNTFDEIEKAINLGAIGGAVPILPERFSIGIVLTIIFLIPILIFRGLSCGLFFTERKTFNEMGGFDPKLCSAEDIDFAKRLKAYGKRHKKKFVILWKSPIYTSCRKFDRLGDWYFILHPFKCLTLLRGRNQAAADEVWYDFPRS